MVGVEARRWRSGRWRRGCHPFQKTITCFEQGFHMVAQFGPADVVACR